MIDYIILVESIYIVFKYSIYPLKINDRLVMAASLGWLHELSRLGVFKWKARLRENT